MLESLGYQVAVAQSGTEALSLYRREGRVDLVILDYCLPGQTGLEVLKELKNLDPEVRVLLVSGFMAPQEQHRVRSLGALGVILKPVRAAELAHRLREALATGGCGPKPRAGAPGGEAPPPVR